MKTQKIKQWCIFLTIATIGFAAFFVLCGEDTPGQEMSWSFFLWSKLIAGVVLYLCYLIGRFCSSRGMFPEFKEPEDQMED